LILILILKQTSLSNGVGGYRTENIIPPPQISDEVTSTHFHIFILNINIHISQHSSNFLYSFIKSLTK